MAAHGDKSRLPLLERCLLGFFIPKEDRSFRLGDLEEVYHRTRDTEGAYTARLWLAGQVLRYLGSLTLTHFFWRMTMILNYIKVALRKMVKQKGYTLINILGLAIGMTATILLFMWVQDERSYDRFHDNANRIYRATLEYHIEDWHLTQCNTSAALAPALMEQCPGVALATRFTGNSNELLVEVNGQKFNQPGVGIGDSLFFKLFTFPLIRGDVETVLNEPNTVALSEETALKYFGHINVVGETVNISNTDYRVTGVFKDMPPNSHFHLDVLRSMTTFNGFRVPNWGNNSVKTYFLMKENADIGTVKKNLADMTKNHLFQNEEQYNQVMEKGGVVGMPLQRLTDIHLNSDLLWEFEANGNGTYVDFFTVIAVFTLVIAAINYMNLATARSAARAREVGIRKTVGSTRSTLMRQFLMESIITSLVALAVAIILSGMALPAFRNLVGKSWLQLPFIATPWILALMLGITLLIGFAAGLYPSFYLSSFKPTAVLGGKLSRGMKGAKLRSVLVVIQFTLSIILLTATVIVSRQMAFIHNNDIGFDREEVLLLNTYGAMGSSVSTFREELLGNPEILSISACTGVPGKRFNNRSMGLAGGDKHGVNLIMADEDYLNVLGMTMAEGRFFSRKISTDETACVINESYARELNDPDLIGKNIEIWTGGQASYQPFTIIGIIKDYHYESYHERIKSLAILNQYGSMPGRENFIAIRTRTESMKGAVETIHAKWSQLMPEMPFEYTFLDAVYDQQYQNEVRTGQVFSIFTVFTIFVACIGLLGLVSFAMEQRNKEIGIRKVLGASIQRLTAILAKEFLVWIAVANVVAWPVAYLIMNNWLENFAYRINLSVWPFLFSMLMIMVVTGITVGFHTLKAALTNPVKSLRTE